MSYLEEIKDFSKDPTEYKRGFDERTKAARDAKDREEREKRERAERIEREMRERAAAEAARREAAERRAREEAEARKAEALRKQQEAERKAAEEAAERERVLKAQQEMAKNFADSIRDEFGLEVPQSFLERTLKGYAQQNEFQKLYDVLKGVGALLSDIRGFSVSGYSTRDATTLYWNGKSLMIALTESVEEAANKIRTQLEKYRLIHEAQRAAQEAKPFRFQNHPLFIEWMNQDPLKMKGFVEMLVKSLETAAGAGLLRSNLVNLIDVVPMTDDDSRPSFDLDVINPTLQAKVTLRVGAKASMEQVVVVLNAVAEKIEEYYPISVVAKQKGMTVAEYRANRGGYRLSDDKLAKEVKTDDALAYMERFEKAFAKLSDEERLWLRNMRVRSPNEGARVLGMNVGKREAWVYKNEFFAPHDASEESILQALKAEVKKKMEA